MLMFKRKNSVFLFLASPTTTHRGGEKRERKNWILPLEH
jgi:hypothetical protein